MIRKGENFGLMSTLIAKSNRKVITKNFAIIKFPLKIIIINEIKASKNKIPAEALTSLSFKTGT